MERPVVPDREPFDALGGPAGDGRHSASRPRDRGCGRRAHARARSAERSGPVSAPPARRARRGGGRRWHDAARDRGREARRLRADAERLLELWGESMRVLLDVVADAAEAGVDGERRSRGSVVARPCAAGRTATGRAWLHVLDGPPGSAGAADGDRVHRARRRCDRRAGSKLRAAAPGSTLRPAGRARRSSITVAGAGGDEPGVYHGHILATGLPEVGLAVRIEVTG